MMSKSCKDLGHDEQFLQDHDGYQYHQGDNELTSFGNFSDGNWNSHISPDHRRRGPPHAKSFG